MRFWFEDDIGLRPLEEIGDEALRKAVSEVRPFVESALVGLLQEELAVVFWENEAGALKMTLRGPDDVVKKAKSLIGERAPIPPTKH